MLIIAILLTQDISFPAKYLISNDPDLIMDRDNASSFGFGLKTSLSR